MEKLYGRKEAAKLLGIDLKTLDHARFNGLISYVQFVPNGSIYFSVDAMQEYVARCTNKASPRNINAAFHKVSETPSKNKRRK